MNNILHHLVAAFCLGASVCHITMAQLSAPRWRVFEDTLRPRIKTLTRHDTLYATTDSIVAVNKPFIRENRQLWETVVSLVQTYDERIRLADSIAAAQKLIIGRLNDMQDIQNRSYSMLTAQFQQSAALVDRSTANTDRALQYIKRVKATGYVSATLMGSVTGGILGGQLGENGKAGLQFSLPGAAMGALAGFLVHGLILDWL